MGRRGEPRSVPSLSCSPSLTEGYLCHFFLLESTRTLAQTWCKDSQCCGTKRTLFGRTRLFLELDRVLDPLLPHMSGRWRFVCWSGESPTCSSQPMTLLLCIPQPSPAGSNGAGMVSDSVLRPKEQGEPILPDVRVSIPPPNLYF